MSLPIVDLHCDLLCYLGGDKRRSAFDQGIRCSISQLRQGLVRLQTMAIFTKTEDCSLESGLKQLQIFHELPICYPQDFFHFFRRQELSSSSIGVLIAFENASGFCSEDEPLQTGFKRLKGIISHIGKPLYVSLTWNTENRFGGGASTQVGLKEDGMLLLKEFDEFQIAVDLSHASDVLAYDIIEYIERKRLNIPLMASHSNARFVTHVERNLPDEIAKEIFIRGGIVGLNLYRRFIGEKEERLIDHLAHWLELGGENHIALGADFFYDPDFPSTYRHGKEIYFEDYQDSSCYGRLLSFLQSGLGLESSLLEKLASKNALKFIQGLYK